MSPPQSTAAGSKSSASAASSARSSIVEAAGYKLPQPEAGPSRSGPSSRRSSTSSASSRKGKERAHDNDTASAGVQESPAAAGSHATAGSSRNTASTKEGILQASGQGDGSGSDEEEEEDDEDGDEDEPVLKYSRLKGKLPEILAKDSASAVDVSPRVLAIGTHNGMVHVLSYEGAKVNSYRPHANSITCLRMDEENDYVATTSMEGRVVIHSLTAPDDHAFDYKRPVHCIALEPGFAKKNTRAFVCGGTAGNLVLQEKGWLGYKEQVLHSGEGPIWAVEWRGTYIAWANDTGVRIYDTSTSTRIGYIDRPPDSPRAELFRPTLLWKDDNTLIIAWADYVKVVRIRSRARAIGTHPTISIEMTAIYQVDCMISGITTYGSAYLILAYIPPETIISEKTDDPAEQRRKAANRPELRIISKGEETSADALGLSQYHLFGGNDYKLVRSRRPGEEFFVVSPKDVVVVRPRDEADHVEWLLERERFEEALEVAEKLEKQHGSAMDAKAIGRKYMVHLVGKGDFDQAASLASKVLASDVPAWEKWIDDFKIKGHLAAIIPYIPVEEPQLGKATYEMILDHLLMNDKPALLKTITTWPSDIYDINNVMSNVKSELDGSKSEPLLLESLGELYVLNRQPAKALPYFLRLRKPNVFDLIRDHNLFTSIQDQALLLVEFDQERVRIGEVDKEKAGEIALVNSTAKHGRAIELLVEHTHSIPVDRVVHQLEAKSKYLYMYLDALFEKDAQVVLPYSDRMVELYAAYDYPRLTPFLRSSNFYDLEKAYKICKDRDYVPEQVFLLGRMGNNKQALMLIIERLGDVQRAIDFAKEQKDEDLWEDLLSYSESRPDFIRALLEHVGSEINPIRLIRRIRDGLEIPGLKPAVMKILQASNLQVGLLEGCQRILEGDVAGLMLGLNKGQSGCLRGSTTTKCQICDLPTYTASPSSTDPAAPALIYLCRHTVHATCALPHADIDLPPRLDNPGVTHLMSGEGQGRRSGKSLNRALGARLGYAAALRARVGGCPVCVKEGRRERESGGGGMVPVAA